MQVPLVLTLRQLLQLQRRRINVLCYSTRHLSKFALRSCLSRTIRYQRLFRLSILLFALCPVGGES